MSGDMTGRRPGRPRSEAARAATVAAAVELLVERGYGALTMTAIANRAGVSRQTVYRWWSNPTAIVLEAINEGAAIIAPLPDTGTLDGDLGVFVRRSVLGARGDTARLLAALMAEAQRDPEFGATFRADFLARRRAVMRELLDRASARGEIKGVDLDLLTEIFFGTLWYRLLAASGPIDRRFADAITRVLAQLARAD